MTDLVRAVNRALAAGDPEAERIPETRQGLAEVIFTIPKDRLRRFATSDHSSANLIVRTGSMGSASVRELERAIRAELQNGAVPPGVRADVTGNTLLVNRSADGIAGNQLASLVLATVVIALLVYSVFRDWKYTLIALTPNVVPVMLFYGILGAGTAPLSIPTSLIGTIVLGITVDDTVHFLSGYRRERAAGLSPEEATRLCLRHVGRAMVIASVMLSFGFNVMNLSEFATLRQFGYLSGMTLVVCILTDLGLLPALLAAWKV
jgi:predicted RND superfamily exporter protein